MVSLYFWNQLKILCFLNQSWPISEKICWDLYYRMTTFSGAFPKRLWGRKKFFNACSGLPTHTHNYLQMLEFANKNFIKINSPYCADSAQCTLHTRTWNYARYPQYRHSNGRCTYLLCRELDRQSRVFRSPWLDPWLSWTQLFNNPILHR
jgi:hypothetical protein